MQIMLAILTGLIAVNWGFAALHHPQQSAAPLKADGDVYGASGVNPARDLAAFLRGYQLASTACNRAAGALESRTGTLDSALDACGESLRAVSDLPDLYPEAAALRSCIDMEGARFSGLNMFAAMREHRGNPMVGQEAERRYRDQFHRADLQCQSDLAVTYRNAGIGR